MAAAATPQPSTSQSSLRISPAEDALLVLDDDVTDANRSHVISDQSTISSSPRQGVDFTPPHNHSSQTLDGKTSTPLPDRPSSNRRISADSTSGDVIAPPSDARAAGSECSTSSQSATPETFHSVTPDRPSTGVDEGKDNVTRERDDLLASHNSGTQTEEREGENLHESLAVPIVGYEVMEQRARFTVSAHALWYKYEYVLCTRLRLLTRVYSQLIEHDNVVFVQCRRKFLSFQIFKVQVQKNEFDSWFIFRRYTDFVRLNDKVCK